MTSMAFGKHVFVHTLNLINNLTDIIIQISQVNNYGTLTCVFWRSNGHCILFPEFEKLEKGYIFVKNNHPGVVEVSLET